MRELPLCLFSLSSFFFFNSSADSKRIYCTRVTLGHKRTELVQNAKGPVLVVREAVIFPDDLGEVMFQVYGDLLPTAAHSPTTYSDVLALSIPYFWFCGLRGCTNWLTWTSASSFFSCASAWNGKHTNNWSYFFPSHTSSTLNTLVQKTRLTSSSSAGLCLKLLVPPRQTFPHKFLLIITKHPTQSFAPLPQRSLKKKKRYLRILFFRH